MRRLVPDTIAGRTLLVLLLGLTVSHALGVALYFTDRASALMLAGGEHVGERIVTVVRLVENAPPGERRRVVELADNPNLRVDLSEESLIGKGLPDDWRSEVLRKSLTDHLASIGERNFLIRYLGAGAFGDMKMGPGRFAHRGMMRSHREMMSRHGKMVMVSLELPDSGWLNFVAPVEPADGFWSLRLVISMGVMILGVVLLSVFVVSRMSAPLAGFARAAERLGLDVNAPALPESGPREVRHAVRAFNKMQDRIRRFVEDRTQMIAAITHDLRTPITRLRLRAEFVEDEEQQRKMLADLEEMESMIASTLSFARDDSAREPRQNIDLLALLHSVCDDLADVGQPVEFRSEGRLPFECRPVALRRAFTNVIENAVKYGERARVSLAAEPDAIRICVDDDGPGIPEDRGEEVFKPFHRLEGSRSRDTGGTGLGLTVARTIARAHAGDITLSNRAGGGLRAEIVLPR